MAKALTAQDITPLIAALPRKERARLLHLIAFPEGTDGSVYKCEPLAWDSEDWEHVE